MKKAFRSKLRVKYNPALGMWQVLGESLTRRTVQGADYYDKSSAVAFKDRIDQEDFHFYHSSGIRA